MPLREKTIVEQRQEAVELVLKGVEIAQVARWYGVSRPTVYAWLERERTGAGMADRSRAPHHSPQRTACWVEQRLIEERRRWGFGSKKILKRLSEEEPQVEWPKRSTIDTIFKRAGLVEQRYRRRMARRRSSKRYVATEAGELMTVDFKGQFRLGNGRYCYPLTMADQISRYVISCEAMWSTELEPTWRVMERCLREHGLPRAMQSDNGTPFGAGAGRKYSTISVRLMKLGVEPVFGRPGKPQDNAVHERMHRTLKEQTAIPPARTHTEQQGKFDRFRKMYNEERPHEGIGMERPGRLYRGGVRDYPAKPPQVEYDIGLETRRVSDRGEFRWRGQAWFLSRAFAGQRIAFEPIAYGVWNIYFGEFLVAVLDEDQRRVLI